MSARPPRTNLISEPPVGERSFGPPVRMRNGSTSRDNCVRIGSRAVSTVSTRLRTCSARSISSRRVRFRVRRKNDGGECCYPERSTPAISDRYARVQRPNRISRTDFHTGTVSWRSRRRAGPRSPPNEWTLCASHLHPARCKPVAAFQPFRSPVSSDCRVGLSVCL